MLRQKRSVVEASSVFILESFCGKVSEKLETFSGNACNLKGRLLPLYRTMRITHIKANWETHQIYQKYRDTLVCQWRAPMPKGIDLRVTGGLQRLASTQILSFGVSSHSFDVDFIKVGSLLPTFSLLNCLMYVTQNLSK